jgi:hypothetical protein
MTMRVSEKKNKTIIDPYVEANIKKTMQSLRKGTFLALSTLHQDSQTWATNAPLAVTPPYKVAQSDRMSMCVVFCKFVRKRLGAYTH